MCEWADGDLFEPPSRNYPVQDSIDPSSESRIGSVPPHSAFYHPEFGRAVQFIQICFFLFYTYSVNKQRNKKTNKQTISLVLAARSR